MDETKKFAKHDTMNAKKVYRNINAIINTMRKYDRVVVVLVSN
jgi:hypothetical protein